MRKTVGYIVNNLRIIWGAFPQVVFATILPWIKEGFMRFFCPFHPQIYSHILFKINSGIVRLLPTINSLNNNQYKGE